MATNFTLCTPASSIGLGSRQPVMDGDFIETLDQAPTGAWAEVAFTQLAGLSGRNVKTALVHISSDVTLRYRLAATQPAGGTVGAQILAGVERTIGVGTGLKLWIK